MTDRRAVRDDEADGVVVDVGGGVRMLHRLDGGWMVEHACREVGPGEVMTCAPSLQLDGGHQVTSTDPLTVTPSILCPDCGLHGYVTEGHWVGPPASPKEFAHA